MSQSPQTGQFNSYAVKELGLFDGKVYVSIPSNGSIQFLHWRNKMLNKIYQEESQSPQTGQFNSYPDYPGFDIVTSDESQSPQTGQFNSYDYDNKETYSLLLLVSIPSNGSIQFLLCY